ncbi:MAG: hypothetical protein R3F37_16310 [Candidatus Competibacteraceae bacterium]
MDSQVSSQHGRVETALRRGVIGRGQRTTGSPPCCHSHFDAMDFWNRYLQKSAVFDGWLGRHLDTLATGNTSPFRAVGMGAATQTSLRGGKLAVAINGIESFSLTARPLGNFMEAIRRRWLNSMTAMIRWHYRL